MTLRLRRIALREIRLPLRERFQISSGTVSERRILLLQLTDVDGLEVWSECVAGEAPNYSPETIDTAWFALNHWIGPCSINRDFPSPDHVFPVLDRKVRGHRMAKAALEMGMWALSAVQDGVSLASRLGGSRRKVAVGISLGIQADPGQLIERARQALKQGYQKIKLKIKPGADLEYVGAVREALGFEVAMMADANSAYTLNQADLLAGLDQFQLTMIEQPLAWDDLVRHARLQERLRTPICLDESITSPERAEDMITLKSGRIINIKPGRVGGFAQSKAIHDLCAANQIPVWCGGMLESGVGRSYNVALASLPNFLMPGDLSPSSRYWERDIVAPEWTMDPGGMVTVPMDRPGIGVEVDLDRVENLTVRTELIGA